MYKRLILFLGFCWAATYGHSQSLYQDARALAYALQRHQTAVVVASDTALVLQRNEWDADMQDFMPQPFLQFEAVYDSIVLQEAGQFYIEASPIPYQLHLQYDTFRLSLKVENSPLVLQNENFYVEVMTEADTAYIPKRLWLEIHAILGTHDISEATNLNAISAPAKMYADYSKNPYLARHLNPTWFEKSEWVHSKNLFSTYLHQKVADKRTAFAPLLEKLYADSMRYQQQLLTIAAIQKEYEVPPVSSVKALEATAEVLEANIADASVGFNTSTLIAGLSDFITERAQEEFNIAFMERFRGRLNDPAYAELHVLFPLSRNFLNQIDIGNYKSALLSARQVFSEDIRKLSFNLPKVFELPKYEHLHNTPEMYNLLVVYSMLDLVARGTAMEDVLPLTFRRVQERHLALDKSLNLHLASSEKARADLLKLSEKIATHEQALLAARDSLIDQQVELELDFLLAATAPEPSVQKTTNDLYFDYFEKVKAINAEIENAWDTIRHIPHNLQGRLFYDDILEEPRIENFATYFDTAPQPNELIGAGLQLSRYMVNGVAGKPNKAQLLIQWDTLLQRTRARLAFLQDSLQAASDWGIQQKTQQLEQSRLDLQQAIQEDLVFWQQNKLTEHDSVALVYLSKTLDDPIFTQIQGASSIENLEIRQQRYLEIREALLQKLTTLSEQKEVACPLLQQLRADTLVASPVLTPNPSLEKRLAEASEISRQLMSMDTSYARPLTIAQKNTAIVAKTLELASHLFLYLRTGDAENPWISTEQWNTILENDYLHDAFFGLLHQRLQQLEVGMDFSTDGLAVAATNFVYHLASLQQHNLQVRYKRAHEEPLRFGDYLPYLQVITGLLNTVLETPVFLDAHQQPYSLVERDTALAFIPQISNHALHLFENVYDENYNFAVHNTLELYKIISERTLQDCRKKSKKDKKNCLKNEKTRNSILVYGTFIADVALAQVPDDIRRALEVVALPPGSSRIKRRTPYNVSLNSYFGVGVGNERLTNPALEDNTFRLNSVGLTVPVGITASWKTHTHQRGSYSVFIPIIDIGAVSAFRLNEGDDYLPELNFQNIIAPGAYFMYNLPKSPFTLGAGAQYGPQLREITRNNTVYETGAWRLMLTATVDVPLFNLFGNRY